MYWLKRIGVKEGAPGQDAADSEIAPHRILTAGTCHGQRPEGDCGCEHDTKRKTDVREWNIGREAEFDGWSWGFPGLR